MELELQDWVDHRDPYTSVDLAQALVFAEAGRLGLPVADFGIPGRITAGDQGIDGRTNFPATALTRFPQGPCVWQIKSGATISAASEFKARNVALHDAIRDGSDYVMFWTYSPRAATRTKRLREFEAEARKDRADVQVHFLDSSAITQLLFTNLAVIQDRLSWLEGVVDLKTWARRFERSVSFKPDPNRERVIDEIRRHVLDNSDRCDLHIVGDGGVGKSRTVFEALDVTGVGERVLVALDGTRFDGDALLNRLASMTDSHLILFVDDCDVASRQSLTNLASASQGRVRLITAGALPMRRAQSYGAYQRLDRLQTAAAKEIAQQFGLTDTEADLVASFTEGYPGLALLVARDFHEPDRARPIGNLIQSHPDVHAKLGALIPDLEIRTLLGALALFEKVGYEEFLSVEMERVCEAFDIDVAAMRRAIESETGAFVEKRGRYRYVTPPLVAAWLVQEYVEQNEDGVVEALSVLPQALIDSLYTQFSHLAQNAGVTGVVTKILGQLPFSSGALEDVDAGAARFLHVAAEVVPRKALEVIERLLGGADDDTIKRYEVGRRELVWAIETLMWDGEVFDRVAELLLKLALNENETYANNSLGVLHGLFHVHLGGTTAPYQNRLVWAERVHARGSLDIDRIIVPALGIAFNFFESRMVIDPGWRVDLDDWRPRSGAEDLAVRMSAWEILTRWALESDELADLAAPVLAGSLAQLSRVGLVGQALDFLDDVDWSVTARRHFLEEVLTLVRMNVVDEATQERLTSLLETWQSGDYWSRLELIASTSRWRLADERTPPSESPLIPAAIVTLARELSERSLDDIVETSKRTIDGDQETVGLIFEEVARARGGLDVLARLSDVEHLPVSAVLGTFGGMRDGMSDVEIDTLLESWIAGPYQDLIVRAMMFVSATDGRADILTRAVAAGANAGNLSILYFGTWCSPLSQRALNSILELILASGRQLDVNHGLGILGGWLDRHPGEAIESDLKATGLRLLEMAPEFSTGDPMVPFHFAKVVGRLDLDPEVQVDVVLRMLGSAGVHPGSETIAELERLTRDSPNIVLSQFLSMLTSSDSEVRLRCRWLETHKFATRIATIVGAEAFLDQIRTHLSAEQFSELGDHINFGDPQPAKWLVDLFEMAPDSDFGEQATFHFIYPTGGWMGPESSMLSTSRARAKAWLDYVGADSKIGAWLANIVQTLDDQIATAETHEAERGW